MIACEDGHANERSLIPQLLERVRPKQCWIADSAYSTMDFMFGVADRKSHFIVRQHGALLGEPQGRRKKIGRVETGVVYEQTLRIKGGDGRQMDVRRVTIQLDKPTKKGDLEVWEKFVGCGGRSSGGGISGCRKLFISPAFAAPKG